MTEDTKKALEIIRPMAKELRIEVDADEKLMYCNVQAIGISCNSTYATIKEFLGYAMWYLSKRGDCRYRIPRSLEEQIKEYWYSDAQLKQMGYRSDKND